MITPDQEEGRPLVRSDVDLTSQPSGKPSNSADVTITPTRRQALKARARAAMQQVFRPWARTNPETVTAQMDLAGSSLGAIPTSESDTIIVSRPTTDANASATHASSPTTFRVVIKLWELVELMLDFATRRPVLIRAFSFSMLVIASTGAVTALGMLDVITGMASALWTGSALFLLFCVLVGLGIWFADRRDRRSDN